MEKWKYSDDLWTKHSGQYEMCVKASGNLYNWWVVRHFGGGLNVLVDDHCPTLLGAKCRASRAAEQSARGKTF